MSDDLFLQFSSNSSNQSDPSLPTKLAKLEARMAGKGATPVQASWSSVNKFGAAEELAMPEQSYSSDSEEDVSTFYFIFAETVYRLSFPCLALLSLFVFSPLDNSVACPLI